MQETISDKKYNKDLNGDSVRDEYRATPIMVYDYYPFGELMPGRSLDTTGLCVTTVRYTVQQRTHWANPGVLYGGGGGGSGPASYGGAGLSASATYSAGVTATGTGGGLQYTISGIPTSFPTLNVYFSALAGTTQVRVYKGSGTGGMQLGSVNVSYTSPVTSIPLSGVIPVGSSTGTITVVVNSVGSYSSSVSLFSIDSIGYAWSYNTDVPYLATQCGNPTDKYEFGFNGKYKDNEIAGVGNTYNFDARMYNPRIGRWNSLDPLEYKYVANSPYNFALNTPIEAKDPDGRLVIFFNGIHGGDGGQSRYWGGYDYSAMKLIGDYNARYVDGALGGFSNTAWSILFSPWPVMGSKSCNLSLSDRIDAGKDRGYLDGESVFKSLSANETIKIITHSMGTAFSRGYLDGLIQYATENGLMHKLKLEFILDVNAF